MPDNPQILVVDDDPTLRQATVRLLKRANYPVLEAATGEEALRLAGTHRPDLILLDVMLPDINGLDVCQSLKTNPALADTYVMLISGLKNSTDDQVAGLKRGADGYIARPVPNQELMARVQAALRFQQAKTGMRASEARSRQLFENMPSGVAVYEAIDQGTDFVFKDFNRAGEQIEGVKRWGLIGRRVTEAFPGVEKFGLLAVLQRVCQTGQTEFFPAGRYEDERIIGWRENYVYKLPSDEIVVIYNDVTARKQAEEALRESEAKFRDLFETMAQGVVYHAGDGSIILANPAAEKILGLSLDQIQGRTSLDPRWKAVHPDGSDFPGDTHPSMLALQNGQRIHNVVMGIFNPQNEDYTWININATPQFKPGEEKPYQVYTTFEDITDRVQEEQRRREQMERELQALITAQQHEKEVFSLLEASQAVLEYQEFEPAARAIFDVCKNLIGATGGYVALLTPDGAENEVLFLEAGGLPCTVDPELPMPIRGLREEAYRTGQVVYHNNFLNSEWMELMPAGHVALNNVMFVPLTIEGGVAGLIGLANKPTDFNRNDAFMAAAFGELAAVALRNSRTLESLQVALHDKEILLQEIHHRVKNNLTIISSLLDLQAQFIDDEKAQQAFVDSQNRIIAMARIHEHLYRSDDLDRVDMADYIQNLVDRLQSFHGTNTAAIIVDVAPDIGLDIQTAIPCGLCTNELVTNALKYAFPTHEAIGEKAQQNHVQVKLYTNDAAHYVLAVKDNGVGLPADFDWENAPSLGLQLVRVFTQQLKGSVTLSNDNGTTVSLTFPKPNSA